MTRLLLPLLLLLPASALAAYPSPAHHPGIVDHPASGPDEPVATFAERLDATLRGGSEAEVEALFTAGYWAADGGGQRFAEQARRKGFGLHWFEVQRVRLPERQRAAVTMDISVDGELVDRIYVYLEATKSGWRVAGIDENEGHTFLYLAGLVDAHVAMEQLPADPELDALGARIVAAASTGGDGPLNVEGLAGDEETAEFLSKVRALRSPVFVRSYWLASISRGAIVLRDAAGTDVLGLHVERRRSGTRIFSYGFGGVYATDLFDIRIR